MSPSSKEQHANMGSNHLSTVLAGLLQAARSWHCQGAQLHCAVPGWDFFNFPFIEETADIPSQIHCWHRL